MHIYVVRQGDSIYSVARKFGITEDALLYANKLQNPSALTVGQTLTIPVYTVSHTVRAGQTVYSVARSLQISPARLLAQNPSVTDPSRLSPGDVLTVTF